MAIEIFQPLHHWVGFTYLLRNDYMESLEKDHKLVKI